MRFYINVGTLLFNFLLHPSLIRFIPKSLLSLKSNPLRDESPWITFPAKEWLGKFLKPNMRVFEYGSGGSTLYIVKRVKELVSVEHDRTWYEEISEILTKKKIANCKYLLIEPELSPFYKEEEIENPKSYLSSDEKCKGMDFRKYVRSIDSFPDNYFDLVIIDGRARPSCVAHALNKVRKGGYIMLDDSERSNYSLAKQLLSSWKGEYFYGPGPYNAYFWETAVWRKP